MDTEYNGGEKLYCHQVSLMATEQDSGERHCHQVSTMTTEQDAGERHCHQVSLIVSEQDGAAESNIATRL
jgi:hypothetical protein